jgi:hypothetical protein
MKKETSKTTETGNNTNLLLATGLIQIYDRKDIIGIVPLSYVEGLWACHIEKLWKYEGDFKRKGVKPLFYVNSLSEMNKIYKSKGLNPYGERK